MEQYGGLIISFAFLAVIYFLMIRPQKKKQKDVVQMRSNLQVGDEVVTIGGIIGKVIKIKDEVITIEIGSDKTKLNVAKWAIGSLNNDPNTKL